MEEASQSPPAFLDVTSLLELSRPRARFSWSWWTPSMILLLILTFTLGRSKDSGVRAATQAVMLLGLFGLMSASVLGSMFIARRQRQAEGQVRALEELVQLRQWSAAAVMLESVLSVPAVSTQMRAQCLVFLVLVLSRFNRFADAMAVHDHLLEEDEPGDEMTAYGMRLGRAMAMLREDHLVDADRAISELRRDGPGANGALALVEIYRDVKTGHPREAIEIFEQRLPLICRQLGQRVADAWFLIAGAHDQLGQNDAAQTAYDNATTLSPMMELHRRYPELTALQSRYKAGIPPGELACAGWLNAGEIALQGQSTASDTAAPPPPPQGALA